MDEVNKLKDHLYNKGVRVSDLEVVLAGMGNHWNTRQRVRFICPRVRESQIP